MTEISTVETGPHEAYARRLNQACDENPHCPSKGRGRLGWLAERLSERYKINVSNQSVARWLSGFSKPREDKNMRLAQILQVDPTWLMLGVQTAKSNRNADEEGVLAAGAINIVAGLVKMDGGAPAYPTANDERARRDKIDLYAVIQGVNYALHISTGMKKGENWQFRVPAQHEHSVVLGVIREGFNLRIFEINDQMVRENGMYGESDISVTVDDAVINEKLISSFRERL